MTDTFDVIIIGGGPGGYVAAIRAAQLGLKTACVDVRDRFGGTCLNIGCIPSKTLLHTTETHVEAQHLYPNAKLDFDFGAMMKNKEEVVEGLTNGIGFLFGKNKVTPIHGMAKLKSATEVEVDGKVYQTKNIILATGSEPTPLPFLPFDEKKILSSTGALSLESPPKSLILVGAGVVGLELSSVYLRLGTEVTVVEFLDHICPSLDGAMSKALMKVLKAQGMTFHLSSKVVKGSVGDVVELEVETPDGIKSFKGDVAMVSIGRRPYSEGVGLETLGIEKDKQGFVVVDGQFRTKHPNIYAIGDMIDGPMLAHKASEEGVAVAEIIAGHSPRVNYVAIPTVVYTSPEIAGVGLTEEQAKALGLTSKSGIFSMKANSRARCTGDVDGMVKVITDADTDRVIGVHIMCSRAGEMIHEGVVAIEKGVTARALGAMSHAHPTYSEAVKEAALAVHKEQIHS